jgi:WD40 repeat protein
MGQSHRPSTRNIALKTQTCRSTKHDMGLARDDAAPLASSSDLLIGPMSMIDKMQYIRLLEQSLRSLGFEDVAVRLEDASGVLEQSSSAKRFREAVLSGDIEVALGLLGELESELEKSQAVVGKTGSGLERRRRVEKARYLLFCNMFETFVDCGETLKALKCLREDIQPLEGRLSVDSNERNWVSGPDAKAVDVVMGEGSGVAPGAGGGGGIASYDISRAHHSDDEFPPLSVIRDRSVAFGDFPCNFGVTSTLSALGPGDQSGGTTQGVSCLDGNDNGEARPTLSNLAALLLEVNQSRETLPHPPKRLRDGDVDVHRQEQLLRTLQELLSPEILIPDNRLEALVEQALKAQVDRCPYHNSENAVMSLMVDYRAGPESLPTIPVHTLTLHADEVWVVQFSPDGNWLLSASKDGSAILWDVHNSKKVTFSRILHSGRVPINIGSFSPTSQEVLIGSSDGKIRVFKVSNGEQVAELFGRGGGSASPGIHQESISAAMWGTNGNRIALSCNKELRMLDIGGFGQGDIGSMTRGRVVYSTHLQHHAYDSVLSADGGTFVSVGQDRMIRYLRVSDGKVVTRGPEPAAVTCLSRSEDGKYLASNLSDGSIHVWSLGNLERSMFRDGVRTMEGDRAAPLDPMDELPTMPLFVLKGLQSSNPGRFVIRSAFGGVDDAFVGTGSESSLVHIWHRESEKLLASVEGHSATVNAVAWNPKNNHMLASASDDHKVIIWLSQKHLVER